MYIDFIYRNIYTHRTPTNCNGVHRTRSIIRYAAFTPAQLVARNTQLDAGNKHHVARSKLLVTRNKLRVARNLLRATSCAGVNAASHTHTHTRTHTNLNLGVFASYMMQLVLYRHNIILTAGSVIFPKYWTCVHVTTYKVSRKAIMKTVNF